MSSLAVDRDPVGLTPRGPGLRLAVSAIEGWPSALPLPSARGLLPMVAVPPLLGAPAAGLAPIACPAAWFQSPTSNSTWAFPPGAVNCPPKARTTGILGVAACPEMLCALLEAADRARLPWPSDFRPAQRELEGLVVPPEA